MLPLSSEARWGSEEQHRYRSVVDNLVMFNIILQWSFLTKVKYTPLVIYPHFTDTVLGQVRSLRDARQQTLDGRDRSDLKHDNGQVISAQSVRSMRTSERCPNADGGVNRGSRNREE